MRTPKCIGTVGDCGVPRSTGVDGRYGRMVRKGIPTLRSGVIRSVEEAMRRSLILLPTLLLSMACGDAGQAILEPVSVASPNPANAIVSVDGAQYEIGCPDYPCPVSPLVLQHIADKRYFWLPPGTFTWPAIYLYILKVPVQLRPVTQPTVVRTPTAPPPEPDLIGPGELIGEPSGANALVVCSNVPLSLNIPDAGTWDFVSGDIEYEYVTWNAASASWVRDRKSVV